MIGDSSVKVSLAKLIKDWAQWTCDKSNNTVLWAFFWGLYTFYVRSPSLQCAIFHAVCTWAKQNDRRYKPRHGIDVSAL